MRLDRRRADSDRRIDQRVSAVFAVKNRVETAAKARLQLGQAEDICTGGITLRRPKDAPFPPATLVRLAFELPGIAEEIAASGVVVQDSRAGQWRRTGVRFVGITAAHERLIEAYCEAATPVGVSPRG